MLHILWMLIKWILILLGILISLVMILVLLILFCPVRYRAAAVKEGVPFREARAEVRVSWLFGGIAFIYRYQNRAGLADVRVLGIPVLRLMEKYKTRKSRKQENISKKKADRTEAPETMQTEKPGESPQSPIKEQKTDKKAEAVKSQVSSTKRNNIVLFWEKLKEIFQKLRDIPGLFHRISLTIRRICDKIDWWKAFINHPRVKAGAVFFKDRSRKLLHHIFPRKLDGQVTFGSENPSVTGSVLAVLGITMPLHKNRVEILPVFDNRNLLEGNITVKGRIYMIIPVIILLELYFNKNIKYIISRWKHREV